MIFNVTDAHDFTITLSNTIASIQDAGQLLTDLEFNFVSQNLSLVSSSGTMVDISGTGAMSTVGTGATGWGFGATGINDFIICVICGGTDNIASETAAPSEGIIGSGPFSTSTSNSSILGNGPHNPFLSSGATYTFHTTTDLTTVTDPFSTVVFSFGTTFGNNVSGVLTGGEAPEPMTFVLTGLGLASLAFLRRRRRS